MSETNNSAPATVDYKSTVFLPQTDFPMKGDLPIKEPKMIQDWQENRIYHKMIDRNSKGPNFTMPDGPPYANGSIHIGHALNKILKDIVIKYKSLQGFQTCFIPGWDCHGLPIEHKVMKDLTDKKKTASDQEILALCRIEAKTWIDKQSEQFQRLGVFADWKNPYYTMAPEYEAEEIREFARAFQKGMIYRGEKPVYWNWVLKTALADAEVEYHQHKSPSIYIKFPIHDERIAKSIRAANSGNDFSAQLPLSFAVWTTTPWTLPANVGVCLNAEFEYGVFETAQDNLILALDLKEAFEKESGLTLKLKSTFNGSLLENMEARHPFYDRPSIVILGPHVTREAGTGCVHTAPGHGADDYRVGHLKYGLPVLSPVDENGAFTTDIAEYAGINIFKSNPLIIERLRNENRLISYKEFEHSYPHCWRSKVPLFFRATPQWFIGMDLESKQPTLRTQALSAVNKTQFFPSWGEARLKAMMENRPDWCLSRQRIWGVPIPIFYCNATGQPLADYKVMMKVADTVESQGGIEAFQKNPPEFYLKDLQIHKKDFPANFGSQGFRHGKDILDVWFDSGICHSAIQKKRPGMQVPADLYLEGSDQHRGWFNTSLLSSLVTNGEAPFKALITHGFVNDSQGRKMSKSLGNVIDPNQISNISGSEILRLWSIYEDYGQDLRCGKEELNRVTETYRAFRNRFKYLLGVLSDFDYESNKVSLDQLTPMDRWVLHELNSLIENVTASYDRYEFFKIYHALNIFMTVTLSATYFDAMKDRLYTWKKDGTPRRSTQTVMFLVCDHLIRMMAPILSFLSEEVYSHFPAGKNFHKNTESIFLIPFPKPQQIWANPIIAKDFEIILKIRSEVQKNLEELRSQQMIKANLEAAIVIQADGDTFKVLRKYEAELREIFIVSELSLIQGPLKITSQKATGEKCPRCWVLAKDIGQQKNHTTVCGKCAEALS
ncbi:MAG: isoleucine--tRNA ligase [Pseudobdellovibrionaceae bacterium]